MPEFNQIKYQNEYNKQRYDRITIMLPKGKKEILSDEAKKRGMSRNELFLKAVEHYLQTAPMTK